MHHSLAMKTHHAHTLLGYREIRAKRIFPFQRLSAILASRPYIWGAIVRALFTWTATSNCPRFSPSMSGVGGLLELYWNFIGVDRNFIVYWYGVAPLYLLVRYWYVIGTLSLRYRYVIGRRSDLDRGCSIYGASPSGEAAALTVQYLSRAQS